MWTPHDLRFRDPYLVWSDATRFAGHAAARDDPAALIPCLLELKGDLGIEQLIATGLVDVPNVYRSGPSGYCTGWARRDQIADLQKHVLSLEFALPVKSRSGGSEPSQATRLQPGRNVVGVIDHGCAFLNTAFRRAWTGDERLHTRIAAVWDQGQPAHGPWRAPPGFGYGGEVEASQIDDLIKRVDKGEAEEALYRECGYLIGDDDLLPEFVHGSHVLDIAGGLSLPKAIASSAKPSAPDRADSADLIFVDVPQASLQDTTGAANGAFMLDAVRYIVERAGDGANVVINISLGAFAGPHDGSSLFERALDHVIDKCSPRPVVTLAAGNGANEKWHAAGELAGSGVANADGSSTTATLDWRLLPGDTTDSFVELWFKCDGNAEPDDVLVRVIPPGESAGEVIVGRAGSADTDLGKAVAFGDASHPQAMVMSFRRRAQPPSDASVVLAVGVLAGGANPAPAGLWRIELTNSGAAAVRFDAWIQRDEPRSDARVQLQSYFESVGGAAKIDGIGALSSIATGTKTYVVGAARLDTNQASAYSPRGTLGKNGRRAVRDVNVLASADESASAFGLYAAGVLSDTIIRISGTSAAAPVAARYWLDELADGKPAFYADKSQGSPDHPPNALMVIRPEHPRLAAAP